MPDVLDKLQKLLALAASADALGEEDEARNAALAACRLIRQHKLVVALPTEAAQEPEPPPFFRWERMTRMDRELYDPLTCSFPGNSTQKPCTSRPSWMLCTPDRVTVKNHLCDRHMAELFARHEGSPYGQHERPSRGRRPPPPIDLARAASEAASEVLGTAGEVIGKAAGKKIVNGIRNAFTRR